MKAADISAWMKEHEFFVVWWKEHRHSGYCEDREGYSHWGIEPWVAFRCDCYRTEYSSDTGTKYQPRQPYEAGEIEKWAKEQQEAANSGRAPTREKFLVQLREAVETMARKFAERAVEAKKDQKQLSEAEVFEQINKAKAA